MEPLGPGSLHQHTFEKLQKPKPKVNWKQMAHAAAISALANDILKTMKQMSHDMKQNQ